MSLVLQKVIEEYNRIIEKHERLIRIPTTDLDIKITKSDATGNIRVKGTIPLIEHVEHGLTRIEIRAIYKDTETEPTTYDYGWKLDKVGGIQLVHLSAWGKEWHKNSSITTNPYHHHHVPFHRPSRKECNRLRNVDLILDFIGDLIRRKIPYDSDIQT